MQSVKNCFLFNKVGFFETMISGLLLWAREIEDAH